MSFPMSDYQRVMRKHELLEETQEAFILHQGWKHEMCGWYWIYNRSYTDYNGKVWQFTALNVSDAVRYEGLIHEMKDHRVVLKPIELDTPT